MTIPITTTAPWLIFALLSAFFGILLHYGTRYPKDPTVVGWLCWAAVLYILQAVIYATWRGWIHWE